MLFRDDLDKMIKSHAESYAIELDDLGRREKAYAVRQKLKDKNKFAKIEYLIFHSLEDIPQSDWELFVDNFVRALF